MKKRILALAGAFTMTGVLLAQSAQAPAKAAAQGGAQQQQQGPKPKSKGEQEALMKVQNAAQANDPAQVLAAISNVLENYTDTEYKPMLLDMAVQAAQNKGDYAETLVWGERALQADPKDIQARVVMAETIAGNTHSTDLDKAQSIAKIRKNASEALDLLKDANTPPVGVSPERWPSEKSHFALQAHDALGQADALEKKNDEAVKEFQLALQSDPTDPLVLARLTKAYNDEKKYDDAIATADKALALKDCPAPEGTSCLDPRVKAYVTAQKNLATRLKPGAGAAAAGATPATTASPAPAAAAPSAPTTK